jgi:cytochrome c peroxidase
VYPSERLSPQLVAKAIAVFERGIVSGPAPFDRWIEGDENAIDEPAKRGFDLFNTKAGCGQCHAGWNFTDDGFHDIGAAGADIGRGAVLPRIEVTQHAFKTPTLRNAALRAPYLHDGSEPTLESLLDFYDRGGDARRVSLATEIRPLHLSSAEKRDLLHFLQTLTARDPAVEFPVLPR